MTFEVDDSNTADEGDTGGSGGNESGADTGDPVGVEIRPGEGIGPVRLGATYEQLSSSIGEAKNPFPSNHIIVAVFDDPSVEVVFAAPGNELVGEAEVLAIGTRTGSPFVGDVIPGMDRTAVEEILGAPPDSATEGAYVFYPSGLTIRYVDDRAFSVGVGPAYELAPDPPPMMPAKGASR